MKLKLPDGPFGAYLFDCDGTIVDSMPLHYIAWKKVLAEWNCTFEERLFYSWGGTPTAEIVALLNQRQGLNMPVAGVISRKENLYYELLPQLKAIPEVVEHIEAQHGRIPFAVVSGGTRESVSASLGTLKLLEGSRRWFARGITLRASRIRKRFCWRRRGWEWRLRTAWCLRIRIWGYRRLRLRGWLR